MLASSLSQTGDFWGPLFCVLCYALIVIWGESSALSWSLCLWIVGSAGIFVLARALGGDVSYSQCVSAIGYSLLPLAVSMVFVMALNAVVGQNIGAPITPANRCCALNARVAWLQLSGW